MAKRVDLTFVIDLPDAHGAERRLSMSPDGTVKVLDKNGNEIKPVRTERSLHYDRPKGPKYQSKRTTSDDIFSVGGLEELTRLDHFIVVDTNSAVIDNVKISAAFFLACKVVKVDDEYHLKSLDGCSHVYELHNVDGNPEMLAILRICNDIVSTSHSLGKKIAFITDSELGDHEKISKQERYLYKNQYLPKNFSLIYASADTGQEGINKLLRSCDSESTKYLQNLKSTGLTLNKTATLKEDASVQYRYTYTPGLEILHPVISEVTLTSESSYKIVFSE